MDQSLHVFLLAGQSNMSGRGELLPDDQVSHDRILVLNQEAEFVPAAEPLHYIEPERTGTGPGMSFARCLLPCLPEKDSIGLVPCAVGGSAIQQWLADEHYRGVTLYSNLLNSARKAKEQGSLKAILWHQGESNTYGGRYDGYKEMLHRFFRQLRYDLDSPALPIIAGELGEFLDPSIYPMAHAVNRDLHDLTSELKNFYVVPSKGLACLYDELHFNREAVIELGKRMCGKYREILPGL